MDFLYLISITNDIMVHIALTIIIIIIIISMTLEDQKMF